MKKTALIISLFIVANSVSAQFTIGPKVGLNISKEYFGVKGFDEDSDFRSGINIGVFGKYEINDKFDIQAELLYSQQGFKRNIPITDNIGTIITKGYEVLSHYINIPLVSKYHPFGRIYIEAGPQVGFCLDSKISPDEYKRITGVRGYTGYNVVDFSLVGGIGFNLGNGLSVNTRYNHGLTYTLHDSKWKNRVIQISLAYDLWSF